MEWWSPAPLMYWTQMAGTMTPALQRYKDGNPFFRVPSWGPQLPTACMDLSTCRCDSNQSIQSDWTNWFNNWTIDTTWFNYYTIVSIESVWYQQLIQQLIHRLFQILCPSHRRQMSLTSSQRFKAISWRISKNSLLPIENNVKHDMAENWDWDATRLVFWLSLLILMLKPFLLLKTALMHTSASWKHGPATLRCLLVCQDVERYCTVWFTWSSCQDLKKANCHL